MENVMMTSEGIVDLTEQEMLETSGGWVGEFLMRIVGAFIGSHLPEIIESANATKRTFEKHPEIFVK